MNEREQFHSQVKRILKPALLADGFRASGLVYRRIRGEVIHLLNLQGSVYGGQCCVNLHIHLAFLPVAGSAQSHGNPAKITGPECAFRTRLAPPGKSDCWWSYGNSEREACDSAESILQLYREIAVPYFERFSSFPADFLRVTPAMLTDGGPLPFPGGNTEVSRALALSRIALQAGRVAEAREFAAFGLAHAGPAVSLKAEFQKILASQ